MRDYLKTKTERTKKKRIRIFGVLYVAVGALIASGSLRVKRSARSPSISVAKSFFKETCRARIHSFDFVVRRVEHGYGLRIRRKARYARFLPQFGYFLRRVQLGCEFRVIPRSNF